MEWLTGTGPRHRDFKDGDSFTKLLRKHKHIEGTRTTIRSDIAKGKLSGHDHYLLEGTKGVGLYIQDYSTLLTAGQTGNLAVTYLGSYALEYRVTQIEGNMAKVRFTVTNKSTIESATHPPVVGYTSWWGTNIGKPLNSLFSSGPLSKTTQTFTWTENIKWK